MIKVTLPEENELLAEFIGIILGDGYVSKYQTSVVLNSVADKDYVFYVVNLIKNLFPEVRVLIIRRKKDKALDIRFNSRLISDFLIAMGIVANNKTIPLWILKNDNYRVACLRGLFDTEGSISFKKYKGKEKESVYKQLNFRNTNEKIMLFVRDTLLNLNLKPTMSLRHSLYLSNDKSITDYRKYVGFSNPKLLSKSLIRTLEEFEKYQKLA